MFKRNNMLLFEVYTDVDYARSVVDRRPTIDYCTFFRKNLVILRSKKQNMLEDVVQS